MGTSHFTSSLKSLVGHAVDKQETAKVWVGLPFGVVSGAIAVDTKNANSEETLHLVSCSVHLPKMAKVEEMRVSYAHVCAWGLGEF